MKGSGGCGSRGHNLLMATGLNPGTAAAEDLLRREMVIALEMTDKLAIEAARTTAVDRGTGGRRMRRGERIGLLMYQRWLVVDQGGRCFVWQQHPTGTARHNCGHCGTRCRHHCRRRLVLVGAIYDHHVVCSIGQIFHKTLLL